MKKTALVYTTIYDSSRYLEELTNNIVEHKHQDEVFIVIIGDLKTPKQIISYPKEKGVSCHYYNIKSQKQFLKRFPKLAKKIPYNSDNRRNIGYLIAASLGVDIIVSLDDDNYPLEDLVGRHSAVGERRTLPSLTSINKWVNPCDLIVTVPSRVFQRGFPFSRMGERVERGGEISGNIALNTGLWLGTPDVYAMTLIVLPDLVSQGLKNFRDEFIIPETVMLPINSQNTAVSRKLLPCYYFVKMGAGVDRFGDVWQGFFAKKCIDAVGDKVTVSHPLVQHRKHQHDYLKDLVKEVHGIEINEKLIAILEEADLRSKTYSDAYLELTDVLEKNVANLGNSTVQKYFNDVFKIMRHWVNTCDALEVH